MKEEQKKNLTFLEELREYTLDSKMLCAQMFSSRIVGVDGISIESITKYTDMITPFEIEVFTLFSILYDDESANKIMNHKAFSKFIIGIRNYWSPKFCSYTSKQSLATDLFMIMALQQFSVQGSFLFKLFRYNYFFTYISDKINMTKVFKEKFEVKYKEYAIFAYVLYAFTSLEFQNRNGIKFCAKIVELALQNKVVRGHLTIKKDDYVKELSEFYRGEVEDYFYGIKLQYLYPLIETSKAIYIPSPYLVVNAVTESLFNRLTEGNNVLRSTIGKEVIESYLFDIYGAVTSVSWKSKEISYNDGHRLSPDVLISDSGYFIFFDTKSKTPSLKLRQLDKRVIDKDIDIYSDNIVQLYQRILDYLNGDFTLERYYSKDEIFAVSVVLEDSYIDRSQIYTRAFEKLKNMEYSLDDKEKEFIHSRIKIMPLRQIEDYVLRNHSIIPILRKQAENPNMWDDYQFGEEFNSEKFSDIFNNFHSSLLDGVGELLKNPKNQ